MFARTDFWIGLAVGVVAGAFGYKLMEEHSQKCISTLQPPVAQGVAEVPVDELMRQKERLEDLIAERQSIGA
ncbi:MULTISPECIES: hypothetical protein [Pelosinus]|jgi:hypothetical protein|uniref:Uncharacterized protein n=2 Tax=Pelosinus TaxID=365348 RepID=A0A1I4I9J1_9FIRM|nr:MULTISPECIES: hypothetical protein [Pelosinus]MBP2659613.1 hypothetical protein [Bacillota bacterium]EIW15438.1 hypothetical protein FB4_1127 [Pelosinus fermentans B4]EIW26871.1 hypothetical protein FA11_1875 [Pelosinus fermentans A11]OAM92180.1 hypothetical protein FR7_00196 [Pelosinus fermentans DSM 17108]SDQ35934.1 hypothetical protein SAMN04515679_0238 [Pelosinus fermentans]